MPLPFLVGGAAAIAAAIGAKKTIDGGKKIHEAKTTMKTADARHKKNIERFEKHNEQTIAELDCLGTLELNILKSFEDFSNVFEKIQNKPEFKPYNKDGVSIPEYNHANLKEVYIGAGVLLGGLGGAAVGAAGGFAAAGATSASVMAFGTASTGAAISGLHGIAATNAALAALGGGSLAVGGGGMALGSMILGGATLGVGLLIGGSIFNKVGDSLSNKADEAWEQMNKANDEINKLCSYLSKLKGYASKYKDALTSVNNVYVKHLNYLKGIVEIGKKVDWDDFTEKEKLATQNTVLLVGLLYNMCKVQLVLQSNDENKLNEVNTKDIDESIENAERFMSQNTSTIF